MRRILIPVLFKLSHDDPMKWFRYVSNVQRVINNSTFRSTKCTPLELMMGTKMKNKEDVKINEVLHEEYLNHLMQECDDMRNDAKQNILKLQEENRRLYKKKRKRTTLYKLNDLVAIQRNVKEVECHDGPNKPSTAAEHMKPWSKDLC
ncbi:hypothetical protein AVEN_234264-1 [Araneus ventricosus]|uniref:Uncharacterized protein n=1 Tax=Araneus ventricosus TaxID=182803 RepID=A0A4Y2A829_ARAVE|nr:hypothetical protein AVEN_234264-1 [Araneus ventricosus]